MPINEHQAELPAPPRSIPGLAWPSSGDETSGAEQSPAGKAAEPNRAGESQPRRFPGNGPVSDPHNLPDGYLDVSGCWTPDEPSSLMDMLVNEQIPQPSQEALDLVGWDSVQQLALRHQVTAPYKLLIASAITLLQRDEQINGVLSTAAVVDELKTACHRGAMVFASKEWRESGRPIAESIPIVRRPNEARRFA